MKKFLFIASLGLAFLCNTMPSLGQALYDVSVIQKIEVSLSQANWDYQMDTAKTGAEGYLLADSIKINGMVYDSVGIKYKGNSSYDSTRLKNPLHIEFDAFKTQKHQGFTDIKLSNGYGDPSLLREVLAYDVLSNYMHCPRSNFAQVYINGQYIGLYSSSENIDKKFCADHFYSSANTFVKCNPIVSPGPTTKSNFRYLTSDSSSYNSYYEIKSKSGWNDLVKLCDTATNFTSNIQEVLDMDRVIWMLAFNNLFVNLDSYNGVFAQNHYSYKDNTGHFNPIIWDLNMCFGAFPFAGAGGTSMGTLSLSSLPQFPITNHATDTYWPLINAVLGNATSKRKYIAHMRTMLNEQINSGVLVTKSNQYHALIDTAAQSDNNTFFSTAQFQTSLGGDIPFGSYSVPGLQSFANNRASYLLSIPEFIAAPPVLTNFVTPLSPAFNSTVNMNVSISNIGSGMAYIGYRFDKRDKFNQVALFDDGLHNDGAANDQVYGASIIMDGGEMQYYFYAENADAGQFAPQRAEHEFFTLLAASAMPTPGDLVINELLNENSAGLKDEYNDQEDWIELFNNSGQLLNLSLMYLSDDVSNLMKWSFPANTSIKPYSFFMIWADDDVSQQVYHTNFKLNKDSGMLFLSSASGTIIDSVSFGAQTADISFGRYPNGTGTFQIMNTSYGAVNNNYPLMIGQKKDEAQLNVYPNPCDGQLTLQFEGTNMIRIVNIYGQQMLRSLAKNEMKVDTSGWPNGLYLVQCGHTVKKVMVQH